MRTRLQLGLLLLALILSACGLRPAGPPTISGVTLARRLDSEQRPIEPTSTFGPRDTIAVSLQAQNMRPGARIRAVFLYGEEELRAPEVTLAQGGSNYVGFTLPPPREGWVGGPGYRVDLYLDRVKQTSADYTIDAPAPNPRVQSITLTSKLDREQRATDRVTSFGPDDRLYASVEVAEVKKGQRVESRWYQGTRLLDTSSVEIKSYTRSGALGFSLEPEESFEPGDYRIEVLLDGRLAKTARFVVAPESAQLIEATMSRGITSDLGAPQSPTDTFEPDSVVYYVAKFKPLPKGTELEARWFKGERQFASFAYTEKTGYEETYFHFTYTPVADTPLEPGDDYRIEVYRSDEQIDIRSFKVAAAGPFGAIRFAPEVGLDDSAPIAAAQEFPFGTTVLYASFSFTGMQDGTPWAWAWTSGSDEPIAQDAEWNHGESGATWVNLTNPNGIIPGDYTLELRVRGETVRSGQVRVQNRDEGDYTHIPEEYERYTSKTLGIAAAHPPGWAPAESGESVVLTDPSQGGIIVLGVVQAGDQEIQAIADRFIAGYGSDLAEIDQSIPDIDLSGQSTVWRGFTVVQNEQTFRGNIGIAKQGSLAYIFLNIYTFSEAGVNANRVAWTVAASYQIS